jgi:3-oxoacyl-[acyl-carrier-protein] synthase II
MGAVCPVGNSVPELWDALIRGANGITPITRFDTAEHKAKLAAEVKGFDPKKYMDRSDVMHSDLYAQYGMAAAVQALEESGVIGTLPPERIGVYVGSGIGGITTLIDEHNKLRERGPRRVSPYFVPMMIANMLSGMIAIRYDCRKSAMPAVTACATGSNAIGEALRMIRHGYADAMIAGGAEAAINALSVAGFSNMQALSCSEDHNAASLPFDRRRSGFVIGDGAAVLVLEEYEHARRRGAPYTASFAAMVLPARRLPYNRAQADAEGGTRAMKDAMAEAGYAGTEAIYINAHGTGTPLNDVSETLAIKNALGLSKARESLISSTKSMTGHMLGAAGALEAVVCLKAINEGVIPPTINLLEPDPECDLNYVPNSAVEAKVALALSNSLGFGGHNACLAFRRI